MLVDWHLSTNLLSCGQLISDGSTSVVLCFSSGWSVYFDSLNNLTLHLSSMKHSWCVYSVMSVHLCVCNSCLLYECNGVCLWCMFRLNIIEL